MENVKKEELQQEEIPFDKGLDQEAFQIVTRLYEDTLKELVER